MFNNPAPVNQERDKISAAELDGHLLIVRPMELLYNIPTQDYGPKDPISVNLVDLSDGGKVYKGAMWFNGPLIGQLKKNIGELVLGTMGKGEKKPGKNAPWTLFGVSDAKQRATAEAWVKAHPEFMQEPVPAPQVKPEPDQGGTDWAPAPVEAAPMQLTEQPVTPPVATQTVELTPETAALLEQLKAQAAS